MGEKCKLNYFFCCPGFAQIFSLGKQKQTRGDRECRDMRKERRSGTPRARLENVKKNSILSTHVSFVHYF